jgi:hypothetical protein
MRGVRHAQRQGVPRLRLRRLALRPAAEDRVSDREIPPITKDTIDAYVKWRRMPGGFVRAVLENNLKEAFARADNENTAAMLEIVSYCYNEIPFACWGSPARVKEWLEGEKKDEPAGGLA